MPSSFDPDQLGELARSQIEQARTDPRVERIGGVTIGDFRAAVEEADRVRLLGISGLHELTEAVSHERVRLGLPLDGSGDAPKYLPSLRAAHERAELARAEIANEYPHLNATGLVSLNSALDALVEHLLVGLRDHFASWFRQYVSRTLDGQSLPPIAPDLRARAVEAAVTVALKRLDLDDVQKIPLKSSGAKRYEKGLRRVGLGAPEDRPIPADLDQALCEVGALRDVWVHRAGRVDSVALTQAPTLRSRYEEGQFVRFTADDYRTYSAALRCYGEEVMSRLVPPAPEHRVVLADWRLYRVLNA